MGRRHTQFELEAMDTAELENLRDRFANQFAERTDQRQKKAAKEALDGWRVVIALLRERYRTEAELTSFNPHDWL